MFLINRKTGKAEKISDTQEGSGEPVITRSSESRQNQRREQRRRAGVVEGEITRTSDRLAGRTSGRAGASRHSADRMSAQRTSSTARKLLVDSPDEENSHFSGDPERQSRAPRKTAGGGREAPAQSCKSYAVWLLARRDYSASTLRTRLLARGYTQEQVDEAMAFVIEHRYQDDARFAEQRSRGAENRAGNKRIEKTLRQKGIAVDLAREQVSQLGAEEERVLVASEKYRSQVARAGMTPELKVKIYRFLAYRGFSSRAIRVAIDALHKGAGNDIDEIGDEAMD